jgi:hypothetical protein
MLHAAYGLGFAVFRELAAPPQQRTRPVTSLFSESLRFLIYLS